MEEARGAGMDILGVVAMRESKFEVIRSFSYFVKGFVELFAVRVSERNFDIIELGF